MRGVHHTARRCRWAVTLVVLWLLGIEVMPNLHLAFHDASTHTHDAAGNIEAFLEHAREHELGIDHDDDDDDERETEPETKRDPHAPAQLAFDHAPSRQHRATGLAHRATALHASLVPIVAPLPPAPAVVWITRIRAASPPIRRLSAASARGPPETLAPTSHLA